MQMADMVLGELDNEAQTTRKFLERLPADKLDWKPHEKSMTAGQLALHIATIPGGIAEMLSEDTAPPPDFERGFPQPDSKQEVLEALDASLAKAKEILPSFSDERMAANWKVVMPDGSTLVEMPRGGCVRAIMLNHWYHHRGQFGVYLRLLGEKVPSSYGPSGDEQPDFMDGAAG